jgi:hypothetical protein
MKFWTNFAKYGSPGDSTNRIEWKPYIDYDGSKKSYMILDKKNNLKMSSSFTTLKQLTKELYDDTRLNELEKCVVAYQMYTFVGNDYYDENINNYAGTCDRKSSEQFIKENAGTVEYD